MDDKSILSVVSKIKTFLALCSLVVFLVFLMFKDVLLQTSESFTLVLCIVIVVMFFSFVLYFAYKDSQHTNNQTNSFEEDLPSGYKILSKLLIFKYTDFEDDDSYNINILKVENLCFSRDGDFCIKSRQYDKDKILSADSVSSPLTSTTSAGQSPNNSSTSTTYSDIKKGDIKIQVNESIRHQNINGMLSKIGEQEVMFGNASKVMKKDDDTFAATSFSVKTDHLRMLLYFPAGKLPKDLEIFQINQNGDIRNSKVAKTIHHSKHLWVIDCFEPLVDFEFYSYWNWENVYPD